MRGVSTGARLLYTQRTAAYDAKNRYSLPDELPLSWADYFAAVQAGQVASPETLRAEIQRKAEQLGGELQKTILETMTKAGNDADLLAQINNRVNARIHQAETATKENRPAQTATPESPPSRVPAHPTATQVEREQRDGPCARFRRESASEQRSRHAPSDRALVYITLTHTPPRAVVNGADRCPCSVFAARCLALLAGGLLFGALALVLLKAPANQMQHHLAARVVGGLSHGVELLNQPLRKSDRERRGGPLAVGDYGSHESLPPVFPRLPREFRACHASFVA